jgi:hypothetical protein
VKNLDRIMQHLRKLEHDFYGQIVIRVRAGRAVMLTEERSTRLEDDEGGGCTKSLRRAGTGVRNSGS